MSDQIRMSLSSDNPDKFAQKPPAKRPSAVARKTTQPLPQKRRVRRRIINVHPEDLRPHQLSFWKDLLRDWKHGVKGLSASFILHAALLTIAGVILITIRSPAEDYFFDLGWAPPETESVEQQARGPVNVAAVELNPDSPVERTPLKLPPNLMGGNQDDEEDQIASAGIKPVEVDRLLSLRSPAQRNEVLAEVGGSVATEKAIKEGLLWLKRQQGTSGNWSLHEGYPDAGDGTMQTETGATALALLCFLGAGQTPTTGEHNSAVAKGIEWLMRHQKEDGNFHDRYDLGHQSTYYAHAQAVIVLCEAYLLSGNEAYREPIEKGLDYLLRGQNPDQGGWKYRPATTLTVGDLSVTGWALMALHTARAAEFEIPLDHFIKAGQFLDSVSEQLGTRYKYMPNDPAEKVSAAMTAEGILCRQFLGAERDELAMHSAVEWLLSPENEPQWKRDRRNVYEWYYTAQTLHNLGGDEWRDWFNSVAREIVRSQKKSGSIRPGDDIRGSWNPIEPPGAYHEYASQAGRLYLTAMCVLILETPYRHAPIYGAK